MLIFRWNKAKYKKGEGNDNLNIRHISVECKV